jgi:thiamine biosynthesis lipoprotein
MGTAVSFDVRDPVPSEAIGEAVAALHAADRVFSPYRPDSAVSAIQRGEVRPDECPPEVIEVAALCQRLEDETRGWFRATIAGTFDPSGAVKAWALDRAAAVLRRAGARRFCINGGGDIVVGTRPEPGRLWGVGVSDPLARGRMAAVLRLEGTAVATSGTAERGGHIRHPVTGAPATQLASVTVTGPDLVTADAWATAAVAMGWAAPERLAGLEGYEALVIGWNAQRWESTGFRHLSSSGI